MFEIKEFYGKETYRYKEICCQLFRYNDKSLENRAECEQKLEETDANRKEDFVRIGAFDNGELYAAVELNPYNINFDGKNMKMCGIGGVVSLPNAPQKGAVKQIYKEAFKFMRKNGQYISHLYPFKANYYRQYGYDVTCSRTYWSVPLEYIPKHAGETVFYDGSEKMKSEIKNIYKEFSLKYNMTAIKDDAWWEEYFNNNKPYVSGGFKYLHYTNGCADAYMSYGIDKNQDRPQDFSVSTIWFSSYDGLKGILSYFITQQAYGDKVVLKLPSDVDLAAAIEFCGGWGKRNVEVNTVLDGTTRIVDVAEVLKKAKCKGKGKITVKITKDEYCPWNENCFTLEFGQENIVTNGDDPDVEMDINAFSSLIFGRNNIENAEIFSNVKIIKNKEELEKVFYKKACFTEEHF